MLAPTLLEFGTEEQKRALHPADAARRDALVSGLQRAGRGQRSRVARSASARLEGDEWVINGQKIWTSDARSAPT